MRISTNVADIVRPPEKLVCPRIFTPFDCFNNPSIMVPESQAEAVVLAHANDPYTHSFNKKTFLFGVILLTVTNVKLIKAIIQGSKYTYEKSRPYAIAAVQLAKKEFNEKKKQFIEYIEERQHQDPELSVLSNYRRHKIVEYVTNEQLNKNSNANWQDIEKEIRRNLNTSISYYDFIFDKKRTNPAASLCIWKALVRYKEGGRNKTSDFMIDATSMAQANNKAINFINQKFPTTQIESLHIGRYSC